MSIFLVDCQQKQAGDNQLMGMSQLPQSKSKQGRVSLTDDAGNPLADKGLVVS
jgi:hypothetical protein